MTVIVPKDKPSTLTDLLYVRHIQESTALIGFLNADGELTKSLSYTDIYENARRDASRLLSAGLRPGKDIVVTSFSDHDSHIRLFWACCFIGVPVCPIPPLHPDPSRQKLFFEHLNVLFHKPTLISNESTIEIVTALVPDFRTISLYALNGVKTIHASHDALVYPNWKPKPSDTVCLMLTSGSTGNSKGVPLRHSNMLSSVRGKSKHHGTTSSSKFLNWIAFDHVACVTEVHLHALESNANQYHVAPTAIISKPRSLLEWCHRYRITYTFSPNFLLAQICREVAAAPYNAQDLDLSAVRAFISGGESVPIKAAVEFSDIIERHGAPRSSLRGGFGMTETGAGCIYDTRPIVRNVESSDVKYLSLGQCCDGVSVRTVDPATGLVCPPLTQGQLQISGPSVFGEYYNNPVATADSFSTDGWFITGDTALLDLEGNLHLVGRDKDCVNINGVKHPSVDVEHYIEDTSVIGAMKTFTYVCPMRLANADTETYVVFYQHELRVEDELSDADLVAIVKTNNTIRNACVVFCSQAPHIILPLPRKYFVKTSLGKISRSTLVTAYTQGAFAALESTLSRLATKALSSDATPLNSVEQVVFESVNSIFDLDGLTRSSNLFDLGASSMHLMRLKQALQTLFSVADIPTIEMLKRPVIGELCDYLGTLVDANASTTPVHYNPLVCLDPNGSKPPLFLVHPGVGEILVFINLARVLKDDRPVYALRARGFDGEEAFKSFSEMVDTYTVAIEAQYPSGPYFVGGYSFGGAVAFEIGKKLEAKGKVVAFVGVFNLPPHIAFRMHELVWVEVVLNLLMFLSLIDVSAFTPLKLELAKIHPEATLDSQPTNAAQIIEWLLERADRKRLGELQLKTTEFVNWSRVAYDLTCTGRSYEPSGRVNNALTTIFCAIPLPSMGTREEFKRDRLAAWENFSGPRFEMIDVDGEHYTMVSETHVESFAVHLKGALRRAEEFIPRPLPVPPPTMSNKQNFTKIPIIDFSLAEVDSAAYLEQLRFAVEDVGFGVFVNVPGFEDSFQKELFSQADELFRKPQEWKDALGTGESYALRGYFRADQVPGPHKAHAEAYRFGADLPEPTSYNGGEVPFWLRLHEGPNQWPASTDLPQFRQNMEALFERYRSLNLVLNHHICQLLDIPDVALNDYFPEKTEFNSAIWHYLPLTKDIQSAARNGFAQGMHEHRDPSTFLTCLIQSRAGLQAQNYEGEWIDIPMVPGGVVCNIGMQLMKLTGGKLVATTHRVNTLKIEEDRYTIPYVLSTRLEKAVVPLPKYADGVLATAHAAPNPKILKLMSIEDPLVRSGYARLSLFPYATQKLYPKEFEEARQLGIV
ncbi:hypothetical protein EUX98_g4225 [Antrodiella citrinella]|uniref:Carrier domain-containing protein n=1 Tax=Antrodiella citrinella TaxID=2447956 RepID=A0A4S4MXB6_9APHY|nr:hypothetical protein EUX98_g4225 [Antrodiella citrinella]